MLKAVAFTILGVFAVETSGQSSDEIATMLTPAGKHTPQNLQEIAVVLRNIAKIPEVRVYNESSLLVRASANRITLGQWLFDQLDKPTSEPIIPQYRVAGTDTVVQVVRMDPTLSQQEFQEIVTLARTISNSRPVVTVDTERVVVIGGTIEQVSLAAWALNELNHSPAVRPARLHEYPTLLADQTGNPSRSLLRIYLVQNVVTGQDFQEIVVRMRTIGGISVFAENAQRALALMGSPTQMAKADSLLEQMDGPRK